MCFFAGLYTQYQVKQGGHMTQAALPKWQTRTKQKMANVLVALTLFHLYLISS